MSDQAFVKAFSRRRRSSKGQVAGQQVGKRPAVADTTESFVIEDSSNSSSPELGAVQLDQSIAATAQIWVDPMEDQVARADRPMPEVPRPHLEPEDAPTPAVENRGFSPPTNTVDADPDSGGADWEQATKDDLGEPTDPSGKIADPLQHMHTAYATAYADAAMMAELNYPSVLEGPLEALSSSSEVVGLEEEVSIQECDRSSDDSDRGHGSDRMFPSEQTDIVEASALQDPTQQTPVSFESPAVFSPPTDDMAETRPMEEPLTEVAGIGGERAASVADVTYPETPESLFAPQTFTPFQAVWEVDVFDVPTPVADLFFEGTLFQQIAERMSEAVCSGLVSVLVTSTQAGEGRSSVAIGIAMAAAASGIRVALVDADTDDPTLADDLRLDLQYGWVDTVRGGLPIKEVAVHAVEDGVTLIPLMPPTGRNAATALEVVQLIELLKNKFELVIIDGPTARSSSIHQCASVVDSAIIVRDMERTDTVAINEFSYRLRESGVQGVGVVENFV